MTDTLVDQLQAHVFLDVFDLAELSGNGTLHFTLGDRRFELHTGPRPTSSEYAIRVTDEHLNALRTSGEIGFRRTWGRLSVAMVKEEVR